MTSGLTWETGLLIYGPLGLVALLFALVIKRIYSDREKERKEHATEMRELEEMMVAKAEAWMTRYHELADAQAKLLGSIVTKIEGHR